MSPGFDPVLVANAAFPGFHTEEEKNRRKKKNPRVLGDHKSKTTQKRMAFHCKIMTYYNPGG